MGFLLGILGTLITLGVHVGIAFVLSFPLTIAWNNLAPKFLWFIPEIFLHIKYFQWVGVFIIFIALGHIISLLIPSRKKEDKNDDT